MDDPALLWIWVLSTSLQMTMQRNCPRACNAYIQHKNLPDWESEWMIPLFVDMGPVHEPANDYAEKLLGVRVHGNPKG